MVLAAVNEAIRAAQELQQSRLGGLTGGMDLGRWAWASIVALATLHRNPGRRSPPGGVLDPRNARGIPSSASLPVGAGIRGFARTSREGPLNGLYAAPVQRLVTELARLPGIGQRTAQRLAFHPLRADPHEANAPADAIREVKERIGACEVCFNLAEGPRCRICEDARRDDGKTALVEEPGDVIPIERTHEYHGLYHVLRQRSPIDGSTPSTCGSPSCSRASAGGVREVVLATNPTTTGEATAPPSRPRCASARPASR